jgi:DNA-binding transcriptional LysR family regulator
MLLQEDRMRLIDFTYIQTVAIEGTISRAASKLYISQPSLSNAIKKIET